MKKNVLLHIGRHKSGTTSLQEFLSRNEKWLEENGYEYLKIYRSIYAHHPLAELLAKKNIKNKTEDEIEKIVKKVRLEILDTSRRGSTLLISSEGFQNCDPEIVRKVFPEDIFNIEIVCYFRDQVSYLISSYMQAIHANFRVDVFDKYIRYFDADYWAFLEKWSKNFENINIRKFSKNSLINSNIIDDFVINFLELKPLETEKYNSNPSLSRRYLSFKLMYNQKYLDGKIEEPFGPGKLYVLLGKFSEEDNTGKLMTTDIQREYIIKKYDESNKRVFEKYLPGDSFEYGAADNNMGIYEMEEDEYEEIFYRINNHKWPL